MKFKNYKLYFWIVLIIAVVEGLLVISSSNILNKIVPTTYTFSDSGEGLVSVEGSWLSTTQLAYPLSTANIDCWKDFGYCWIANSTIMNFDKDNLYNRLFGTSYLTGQLNLEEIAVWNDDYIETKPSVPPLGCIEEKYRLDRKTKVVTYTRRTIKTTDACKDFLKDPIVSKLGDGLERLRIYKQLRK